MALSDLLSELQSSKNALATNLVEKGVSASINEGLTTLVPKVLDITTANAPFEVSNPGVSVIHALITHLLSGDYETGTFNTTGCSTEGTIIFDTNLDRINGFVFFDNEIEELTQETVINIGAQRVCGGAIYDYADGEPVTKDAFSRDYVIQSSDATTHYFENSMSYGSVVTEELKNGSLMVKGQYAYHSIYAPFVHNRTYRWIAW